MSRVDPSRSESIRVGAAQVMANLVWAYGEIFLPEYDEPLPLLPVPDDAEGLLTMRWWSAWTLVNPH